MAEFSYIVLDLEWNQPLDRDSTIREPFFFDSEIIEIGALRLDEQFRETGSFKTFIRPRFYLHMNGDVVRLTKYAPRTWKTLRNFPGPMRILPSGAARIAACVPGDRTTFRC